MLHKNSYGDWRLSYELLIDEIVVTSSCNYKTIILVNYRDRTVNYFTDCVVLCEKRHKLRLIVLQRIFSINELTRIKARFENI